VTDRRIAVACARAAEEKKGGDILVLDLRRLTDVADYFVLATGSGRVHVSAIVEGVRQEMRGLGVRLLGAEGVKIARWVLLDLGRIVVHVFQPELRAYYDLESFWGDAPKVAWRAKEKPAAKRVAGAGGRGKKPGKKPGKKREKKPGKKPGKKREKKPGKKPGKTGRSRKERD